MILCHSSFSSSGKKWFKYSDSQKGGKEGKGGGANKQINKKNLYD